jgi:hypothetical protein
LPALLIERRPAAESGVSVAINMGVLSKARSLRRAVDYIAINRLSEVAVREIPFVTGSDVGLLAQCRTGVVARTERFISQGGLYATLTLMGLTLTFQSPAA